MLAARFYAAKDIRLEDVPVPSIKESVYSASSRRGLFQAGVIYNLVV